VLGARLSLASTAFYRFISGKIYRRNINKSDFDSSPKSSSLISWHILAIGLFVSAAALRYLAYNSGFVVAVDPIIDINFLSTVLFFSLGLAKKRNSLLMPDAYFIGATALLGWLGIS